MATISQTFFGVQYRRLGVAALFVVLCALLPPAVTAQTLPEPGPEEATPVTAPTPDPRATAGRAACTAATLTSNFSAVDASSQTITFTATAVGCASAEYRYWFLRPGQTTWVNFQPYTTVNTVGYTPGLPYGEWTFLVYVREAGSTAAYQATASVKIHVLPGPACSGVSAATSPLSPQPVGTTVTLLATPSGCGTTNLEYRFWVLPPDGTWGVLRGWETSNQTAWSTAGLPPGRYYIATWVRRVGNTVALEASTMTPFDLGSIACTGATLTSTSPSPAMAGTIVEFTAQATPCTGAQYQFWLLRPNGIWSIVQPYSANSTWTWKTLEPPGSYTVSVWVRRTGATETFQAYAAMSFTLTGGAACTRAELTASPASPQRIGTLVSLSASAAPCTAEFRLWLLPPGAATWQELTNGYTTTPTLPWSTSTRQAGTHTLALWARSVGSTTAWEATDSLTYALTLETDSSFPFSNNTQTAIPDVSTINIPLTAANVTGYVSRVEVELHITHPFTGDIDLTLLAPDGTSVLLAADRGSSSDNFGNACNASGVTRFSDDAPTSIGAGTGPFLGTYRPESPLFVFAGRTGAAMNGSWTLRITDDQSVDTGTFLCWTLRIHTTDTPPRTGQRPLPPPPPPAVEEPKPAASARTEESVTR